MKKFPLNGTPTLSTRKEVVDFADSAGVSPRDVVAKWSELKRKPKAKKIKKKPPNWSDGGIKKLTSKFPLNKKAPLRKSDEVKALAKEFGRSPNSVMCKWYDLKKSKK